MAPLPIGDSSGKVWDGTQVGENPSSGDEFSPLPRSPKTPDQVKRKKKPPKKSPQPTSPDSSIAAISPYSTKSTPDPLRKDKKSPQTHPPPPPLSGSSSHTKNTEDNNKGKKKSSDKKSTKNKTTNKSISNPSPRTDSNHRKVANAAAVAASLRRIRRPRKRLHWNNSVRVKVIHNLSNYSDQEKLDSWYWPDEYSMMEDECELTSIYMDEILFEQENAIQEEKDSDVYRRHLPAGFCERGLESWTMLGEELKEQQVQLVIDTVWQAQIDAWEFLGNHPANSKETKSKESKDKDSAIHDECWDFIRERSSAVSRTSLIRAREFGIMDEQEVDSYLNSVRSLEITRRRITKMLGGKSSRSSRSLTSSSRNLTKSKSCRTLTTVASSGTRSYCDNDNLKSILKSPSGKRNNYDMPPMRRSVSHSQIPSRSRSEHNKDNSNFSFRIPLPNIGDDNKSFRSTSLRSNSHRSSSLRSNSLRNNNSLSGSYRSNGLSASLRSNSLRSNNGSLRSQLSRSQSVRTSSVRSSRSNLSRSNSLRSNSVRSNSVRSNVTSSSVLTDSSKKIRYKPKSKIKIPTSPVGSVCNSVLSISNHNSLTEEEDLSMRMMRSHMSIGDASEGSSRRRMLRNIPPSPPLL